MAIVNKTAYYNQAQLHRTYAVELRRHFHSHPEKSRCEVETSKRIRAELEALGIPYVAPQDNITVGTITGAVKGPVIGLRADIDALEIVEKNRAPYRSLHEGLMHACGHDAHTAALLTAARLLLASQNSLPGTVKLIFQPAEELGTGAQEVISSGAVDECEVFFGIHVRAMMPVGQIALKPGALMGGANSLQIHLTGQSGHGGRPEQTVDTIAAGAAVVQSLQQIVSREISPMEPAVISVCQFHAGTRDNIIAGEAHISGTVRMLSEATRQRIAKAVPRVVTNVAAAHRVNAQVECEFATDILTNDASLHQLAVRAAENVVGKGGIVTPIPELGTEDFSVYRRIAPNYFAIVGAGGSSPHHSDTFDIDEESIIIAAALHAAFVAEYMKAHADPPDV